MSSCKSVRSPCFVSGSGLPHSNISGVLPVSPFLQYDIASSFVPLCISKLALFEMLFYSHWSLFLFDRCMTPCKCGVWPSVSICSFPKHIYEVSWVAVVLRYFRSSGVKLLSVNTHFLACGFACCFGLSSDIWSGGQLSASDDLVYCR